MATAHGRVSTFSIDNSAGSPQAISTNVDDVSLSMDADVAETTGINTNSKIYILGQNDGTISLGGAWDDAATTGSDTVLGGVADAGGGTTTFGSLTFAYVPDGTAPSYGGECFLTNYTISSSAGGRVSYSGTAQVTAGVTRT